MDHRKQMVSPEVAMASDAFDQFCSATTLKSILGHFRHLCDLLKIKPTNFGQFYPKLKSKLRSWKAQALWKKFDQRANHKCYNRGKACPGTRVLIIGGGPCGMRTAIEAQLLGAKVVVVEKRDRMSRNNVLHLWPFVIQDLRSLGAKKFFGKFCAGSIDHISIRQLQCILLKVALILGVEFHESVSFEALVPPPEDQEGGKIGWRAKTEPADHPVSQYEFDVLIGADGKRNTLEGFKRKEFRGKLAIAITANFINKRTEAEARVEEISGVAFIFNQKFFKELYSETGIDLENIVYYKDDTHYFVMTAKKHSLIDKGVIMQDHPDTAKLLAKENVDREALMEYAREAAEFSTEYQMMDMEFAVNHYGQPDVAMFDFTSMYAAENASRVIERRGHRLLMILVGDSLLEPFWPTGSGCARGFLSSLDAGWVVKGWGAGLTPLEVIAERESIYRLLNQTTPENLNRDYAAYTIDPHTRYPNLNVHCVTTAQVRSLLDTDDPATFNLAPVASTTTVDLPKKRRRRDSQVHPDTLLHWLQRQVALYDGVRIHDMGVSFKSGLALAAIVNRYRPDLLDFHALKKDDQVANNQLVFDVLEKELGITSIMTGEEMVQCDVPDKLTMFSYLTQIYEAFRGEIPHIKHPKLEPEADDRPTYHHQKKLNELTPEQKAQILGRIAKSEGSTRTTRRSRHSNENLLLSTSEKKSDSISRRHARKRRSNEKMGATVEERMQRLMDIETNRIERMLRRQQQRKRQTEQFYKSLRMLQANAKRDKDEPFEDYSIFLYRQTAPDFKDRVKCLEQKILYPDREAKLHAGHHRGSVDEDFSGRIKNIEEKLKGTVATDKKPKDLLRAIGKIEKTDWNVKEIEKKIEENKMGRGVRHDRVERVPKWSREQFLARQIKMEKRGRDPMETDSKYTDIDTTLKNIDRKIKEGNLLGHNKVSAMAEQFASKNQDSASASSEPKVQRSNSKVALALPAQGGSEMCHFCEKRVYLMERLTAEGKSFHRGCFRCEYCSTSLRIGNHTFDRDKNGGRFYCTQHFGLPGTMKSRSERRKLALVNKENIPQTSNTHKTPDKPKTSIEGISGLDLLDRGQTPERIEFENLAGVSDNDDAHSIMDEDEWTDRNFGQSAAEMGSSDDISDLSDSEDDNEVYEEAMDQPLTTEGTLELAKNWTLRYSHPPHPAAGNSDTGSNEYEDSSDDYTTSAEEDSETATDDEEDARARELRKQEVYLPVPLRNSDTETGSDTEIASDDGSSTSSSSEEDDDDEEDESMENSATEISTDSEFEHDGTTPTQSNHHPFVRKTRGDYVEPKKVQIKSRVIKTGTTNGNSTEKCDNGSNQQLSRQQQQCSKLNALNESTTSRSIRDISNNELNSNTLTTVNSKVINTTPLINPRKGDYLLNRTHSTEGIASKLSLELKKRYLLGGTGLGSSISKSGSTSNVDTRLRNLSDAISQHQKLLNPAPEPSPTMQAFLHNTATSKLRVAANNQQALSPLSPNAAFNKAETKNFTFENKTTNDADRNNAKNVQLPDLIKETNKLKELEIKLPPPLPKSAIPEEKLSPMCESATTAKSPEATSPTKIETPTPTVETKNFEPASPRVNGAIIVNNRNAEKIASPIAETVMTSNDWSSKKNREAPPAIGSDESDEIDSDSLSSSDVDILDDDDIEAVVDNKQRKRGAHVPPKFQILTNEDSPPEKLIEDVTNFEPDSIECSNLLEDVRSLEQKEKEIDAVNSSLKQLQLAQEAAVAAGQQQQQQQQLPRSASSNSSRNSTTEENDPTTAAYTETEFSEWARDGDDLVSEDLRDVEYDMNPEFQGKGKRPSLQSKQSCLANGEDDLTDVEFDYSREDVCVTHPNTITSKMLVNGGDIGFMDTDNDSNLEEDSLKESSKQVNRGYVEFVSMKNSPTAAKRPTDAPIAKADREYGEDSSDLQTPCNENNVIEFDPVTMDDVRHRLRPQQQPPVTDIKVTECENIDMVNKDMMSLSMEEDSLLIVEQTEDTTTSEVVTVLASPRDPVKSIVKNNATPEETPTEPTKTPEFPPSDVPRAPLEHNEDTDPDYLEYVKRLQDRIAEFGNVKDSLDLRKSRRKTPRASPLQTRSNTVDQQHQQHESSPPSQTTNENTTSSSNGGGGSKSPATSRKLEELTRERTKQKSLVQDLLMEKLEAQKARSAEKRAKRQAARTASFNNLSCMRAPPTPTMMADGGLDNGDMMVVRAVKATVEPSDTVEAKPARPSILRTPSQLSTADLRNNERNASMTPASRSSPSTPQGNLDFKTPVAPIRRIKHEDALSTAEKARYEARERARLKSDEDLGLSPEDRLKQLRMKINRRPLKLEMDDDPQAKAAKRYSFGLYNKSPTSKLPTSKSTDNVKAITKSQEITAKSLDELLVSPDDVVVKREKKKSKDPERRKSIIQAVSDFFKKSPPGKDGKEGKDGNHKLSMFRLTPKGKDKSKLFKSYSDGSDLDKTGTSPLDKRPKSVCEGMLHIGNFSIDSLPSPPPVPPPPMDYILPSNAYEDSLSDEDSKTAMLSSSQQVLKNANGTDGSSNSISRRYKNAKKLARQAQLKRLRMAQEIQRKLEETDVKQRELESRGVSVEKSLRGEGESSDREEADLLREWFDLMRERTELRRYEKELLVRAQEVQLEDRHDRLQQELRERLADDDGKKTSADVKKEGEILTEMLEIVAKRDSLIALLEEERQRCRRPSCPTHVKANSTAIWAFWSSSSFRLLVAYVLLAILLAYTLTTFLANFVVQFYAFILIYFLFLFCFNHYYAYA
ncbi:F-actin-monooxygenase Mical isoform X3 [Trichogramma pretiosum]|uniref:F-actin-monooxygenase Mical isoform X3 n=1 Tax=Trichogramma pretiosum TaxID=7493 RepID=UPI000C718B92|nr:F-actin-monooxygenase Mical isoform X3 [Trichogramma pretiosum]